MLFNDWLNDLEKKIFVLNQSMEPLSPTELSTRLNLPVDTVVIILRKMVAEGKINPGKVGDAK